MSESQSFGAIEGQAARTLLEVARRLPRAASFGEAAPIVFEACKTTIGATAGYLALLSEDGSRNEVVHLDAGGLECTVDPTLPMPIRGLRERAYREGKPVFENDFADSDWPQFLPEGHARLDSVLFAPIAIDERTRGLIGLANKVGGFTERDAEIAEAFGALAALALRADADRRQLADHERTTRLLSHHAGVILWRISREGRWEYVSPSVERVRGFSVEEAMAQSFDETFANGSIQQAYERFWTGGIPTTPIEFELTHKNGSTVWLESIGTALYDEEGTWTGFAGLSFDITQRKLLEEQLRQSQKMEALGQLAAGVTHDFGNHLAAILLLSGLAIDETGEDDPRRRTLERIRAAANAAAELTDQLLAFSRRQTLEATSIDLNEIVLAHIDVIRRTLPEYVRIHRRLASAGLTVMGDVANLSQVLMNLSLNARDAMPEGGQLTFGSREVELGVQSPELRKGMRPGKYACLSVSDTGTGMPEEVVRRAFEPFFTTKPIGKGTGLGLSTVFGVVQQLGGSVELSSRENEGSTVKLLLPLTEANPSASTRRADEDVERGTETILLIEDEEILRETLRRVLQHLGYRVVVADSTAAAREAADRHGGPIDIVVADAILPDASGEAVIESLDDRVRACPVLFVSGHTPQVLERAGIGPDREILRKPFGPSDLARRIRSILGN